MKTEAIESNTTFDNSKYVPRSCFDSNKNILKKTELVGSKAQICTSTKAINNKQPNKFSSAYNSKYKNDLKANKSSGAIKLKQSNSISFSSVNNISTVASKPTAQKIANMKLPTARLIQYLKRN